MFFHVLKNGCRIEALQLASIEKIERAVVLYMVVGLRIARLMRLGRSCPDLDAQRMFEPDEWKAAYILNKRPLPAKRMRAATPSCSDWRTLARSCARNISCTPCSKNQRFPDAQPGVRIGHTHQNSRQSW